MSVLPIVFIANPKSGTKGITQLKQFIELYIDKQKFRAELQLTEYAGHAYDLALHYAQLQYYAVLAVGGDGTVNEVAKALRGTNTSLGIVPKGSGNGFARVLGIPLNVKRAIQLINNSRPQQMDIGLANDEVFVNNCGVGIDAHVAKVIQQAGKRGFSMYAQSVLKALRQFTPLTLDIQYDDAHLKVQQALLLSIANGHEFGYGFSIAPQALPNDGLLDMVLVEPMSMFQLSQLLYKIRISKSNKHPKVKTVRASRFTIAHPELQSFQVDGDVKSCEGVLQIVLEAKSLKVLLAN